MILTKELNLFNLISESKKKRHWFKRLLGMFGSLLLVGATLIWILVGISLNIAVALVCGLLMIGGPAVSEGGGVLEIVTSTFEVAFEGLGMVAAGIGGVFGFIGDFFSGLGG